MADGAVETDGAREDGWGQGRRTESGKTATRVPGVWWIEHGGRGRGRRNSAPVKAVVAVDLLA